MGRNNNNAGIHIIPRGYQGPSETDEYDKYYELIADSKKGSLLDSKIIEDINACNFITIWDKKGKYNECKCRCSKLKYADNKVKYHKSYDSLGTVVVPGKVCPACGRMYVVRDIVLNVIKQNAESK